MIFRIRFAKYGVVKFIGHLDVMLYFQKAVRRSGLPIKYSQGFNPHQLMVFAQPLGVGVTSDGEYMDIETEDADFDGNALNAERVREILGAALTEGFEIVSIREIPWQEGTKHPENAMALVKGADYIMSLRDGYKLYPKENATGTDGIGLEALKNKFAEFINKDSITVSKKSKSGERDLDIKPYIYDAEVTDNTETPEFMYVDEGKCLGMAHADVYEPGIRFFFRLSAGSEVNIKPELVLEAFLEFSGLAHDEFAFQIHRANMYSDIGNVIGL
ncbi:MAG: TIGR03936 family radical SAM-associated protein [Lachnospiraceae bacterium]|nr:TIGR03936 family radical SAM-associated protein [Lachnospiraceae bacterium]